MPLVVRAGKDGASLTELLLNKMHKMGLNPNIVFRCGSVDAIKTAVRNGTSVGILVHDTMHEDDLSRREFAILEIACI